jgi:5-methylthioribose kinase
LVLKAVHRPPRAGTMSEAAAAFLAAYGAAAGAGAVGGGVGAGGGGDRLLGAHLACLLLARVDGLSPAAYLTPAAAGRVRGLALAQLAGPGPTVAGIWRDVREAVA